MIGLAGIGRLGLQPVRAATAFSPAVLFAAGEQGAWYDPTDLSTLFQDSAGTTPVTAVEQPVGRWLDKSGRGNHATQSTSLSRPTYSARYNLLSATATLSTQNVTTLAAAYTLRLEGAGSVTLSGTATGTFSAGTHSVTCTAGTLTVTVSGTVNNADLRLTADVAGQPAYQAVTNSTTYDTANFRPYLRFDGSDDSFGTASIDFSGTDKVTVWAGVTALNDVTSMISELSINSSSQNGSFSLLRYTGFQFASRGTAIAEAANAPWTAPQTNVLVGQGDIAADVCRVRRNGSQIANVTTDQGTGNFGNYPLFIGARNNASLRFNGRLYGLIVRGAQSSADQIAATESWLNQRTGAY